MTYADAAHNARSLEQQARIEELELRLSKMEKMYDKVAADLIEALDVASAYRATASTLHQEVERRTGVERRQHTDFGAALRRIEDARDTGRINAPERRKSWPH
jgi:hypothetical protein